MILVTGCTGFVGRRVLRDLLLQGLDVRPFLHSNASTSRQSAGPNGSFSGDILEPSSLTSAMKGVTQVVHLVATIREHGSFTFSKVNHEGTRNVVEAAYSAGVKHLVYLSGIEVSDDPRFPFLRSKWMAEQEIIRSGIPYTILRSSILFGRGDEFLSMIASLIKVFPIIPVAGNGQSIFQPLSADDISRCIGLALEQPRFRNQLIEIGGDQFFTYNQMIDLAAGTLGKKPIKLHIPMSLIRFIVRLMELSTHHLPVTSHQLDLLRVPNYTTQHSLEEWFGFAPRRLQTHMDYLGQITLLECLKAIIGISAVAEHTKRPLE